MTVAGTGPKHLCAARGRQTTSPRFLHHRPSHAPVPGFELMRVATDLPEDDAGGHWQLKLERF